MRKEYFYGLFYLTFLNFGVFKKIILKLKINIEIVRIGIKIRTESELRRGWYFAKIKCMKYVVNDIRYYVSKLLIANFRVFKTTNF